jgi:hypothetical protein
MGEIYFGHGEDQGISDQGLKNAEHLSPSTIEADTAKGAAAHALSGFPREGSVLLVYVEDGGGRVEVFWPTGDPLAYVRHDARSVEIACSVQVTERDIPQLVAFAFGTIGGRSVWCIGGATSRIQAADAIVTMVGATLGERATVPRRTRRSERQRQVHHAEAIAERIPAAVVVGDDFYAGGEDADWAPRTPQERASEVIDWRRLRRDVLEPLLAGRPTSWPQVQGV